MPGNDVARRYHVEDGSEIVVTANKEGEYNYYRDVFLFSKIYYSSSKWL